MSASENDFSALEGVRVLDLSQYAPGPYATMLCARMGAEVIKVERPGAGDPLRHLDPDAFTRLNAEKKSLALDLKDEDGRRAFSRLVESADVLVEGFRPGVMKRLELDYEQTRDRAPRLVYLSLTGYGQSGPYRDRAGHDVSYMAAAGALEGAASPLALQVADFAAGGLFAVIGILAALMERRQTGRGRYLDLSMHHALLSLMMLTGKAGDRLSGRYPGYTVYPTLDRHHVAVGALEPKFWRTFCETIGRRDLEGRIDDPRARSEVAEILATRDREDWEAIFTGVDACVEIVRTSGEARSHPQAIHRGADVKSFSWPFACRRPPGSLVAPTLGAHTREVLLSSGASEEELLTLRSRGVC